MTESLLPEPLTWPMILVLWREWLPLEALRQSEVGQDCPALVRMAQQRRDAARMAAQQLMLRWWAGSGAPAPNHLRELLLQLASRVGTLRSQLAQGAQPLHGRYGAVLVGELASLVALLDLALAEPSRLSTEE